MAQQAHILCVSAAVLVVCCCQGALASGLSDAAQRTFEELEHGNQTARPWLTTAPPQLDAGDPILRHLYQLILNASVTKRAFLYRLMFIVYIRHRQQRIFPAGECLSRQCQHGNKRYNCGANNKGNPVRAYGLTRQLSGVGACVHVDMPEHIYNGQACYAELWLNNNIVRGLLRGSRLGQRGVLSVRGATLNRTLSFAMNASAKRTHRWAMIDMPEVVDGWSGNNTTNHTYNVCWRPATGDDNQLPALRLKRLHTRNLNFSIAIDDAHSKPFFLFGVIPSEKPTLPPPPKSTRKFNQPPPNAKSAFGLLKRRPR